MKTKLLCLACVASACLVAADNATKPTPPAETPDATTNTKTATALAQKLNAEKIFIANGPLNLRTAPPEGIFQTRGDTIATLPAGSVLKVAEAMETSTLLDTQQWVRVTVLSPKEKSSDDKDKKPDPTGWIYVGKLPNGESYLKKLDAPTLLLELKKPDSVIKTEVDKTLLMDRKVLRDAGGLDRS